MTSCYSSRHSAHAAILPAQVTALTTHRTALGDRIYAVFRTVDGSTLGLWSPKDHPALRTLQMGDTVALKRNANGHLSLAIQPTNPNLLGLFTRLHRLWRLL